MTTKRINTTAVCLLFFYVCAIANHKPAKEISDINPSCNTSPSLWLVQIVINDKTFAAARRKLYVYNQGHRLIMTIGVIMQYKVRCRNSF